MTVSVLVLVVCSSHHCVDVTFCVTVMILSIGAGTWMTVEQTPSVVLYFVVTLTVTTTFVSVTVWIH